MTSRPGIDTITLEIIRNRLDSIIREMGDITLRTARSAVVTIGRDFSCGILNRRCELMAVGTSLPPHIFPIMWQVRYTLDRFKNDVHPGDIFMGNDPYDGGTHLNDVLLFIPVFYQDEVVAFAANRAHWYDVGGMVPGSISGGATEIYQEGVRIPPIRVGEKDRFNPNVLDLIVRNVRVPHETLGDIWAQLASCRVAARHILGLIHRYGKETVLAHFDEILNAAERRMRSIIRGLPEGRVVHEGYVDNDGVQPERRRIRVAATIRDGEIVVDYTGTAPQSKGCLNTTMALTHSFAFGGVKAALDPKGPINSGCFRPIRVIAPEGTMLNARHPAAAGGWGEVGQASILAMMALTQLAPHQVSAEEGAAANHQNFAGVDMRSDDPHRFIYYDYPPGGGGGRAGKDGLDFVKTMRSGNVQLQSLEAMENLFPVHFERLEFRQDSGGPGEFRGGLGAVREYRALTGGLFSMLGDQSFVPPSGVFGGEPGAPSQREFVRQGHATPISPVFGSKAMGVPVQVGDVIRSGTQGGGGYGDPLERDPARVREDVRDGKVSLEQARRSYGVALVGDELEVDLEATRREREVVAKRRIYLEPRKGEGAVFAEGMRMALVSPALSSSGFAEGDLAEICAPRHPMPLRVRVGFDDSLPAGAILVDTEAWDTLELEPGDRILWRRVAIGG